MLVFSCCLQVFGVETKRLCVFIHAFVVGLTLWFCGTLNGVARLVSETADVHCTRIVELVSLASDTLLLESRFIIGVLLIAERRNAVICANYDPLGPSPDPRRNLLFL